MSKIKFCGIQPTSDLNFINQLAPDYIGLVFAQNSQRVVNFEAAQRISQQLHRKILKVGVFVDAPKNLIASLVEEKVIDLIQLHGHENEAVINDYKQSFKLPIIKAFGIQNQTDVLKALHSPADYLLFDYKQAGSGQCFDWRYIQNVNRKYFLAGGINRNNLKQALALKPYAIDLSSAIETNGIKDNQKMQTIINQLRG
ncbi:hypothetical protein I568_01387 [Enterococcus columbae DSM 7374 = ATCC 51263]|uniref:N-(5'-phosphoribosyl)anthranilate isomerase n=1 Tax=Enterococcus columbae DSM 7374 = ATCC 51263 TaxID=1121865 RepID=S0KG91_9ENTE|nr:phosphoribosylanthranilate isomerase [Enterococcus columbae]EOT39955.1 hypothetical protein OMW_01744 [Enterococcus columbae DSM 7374 = ATCC 51263]EOW83940.1 hypothetical protein I568_01387 [Enterococcus columbae DSM 7374 = ATCC 51263]